MQYDWLAYDRCQGNTGPCVGAGALDDYYVKYAGTAKLDLSVEQQFARSVSGYVSVEDMTNQGYKQGGHAGTGSSVPGRITSVGVRVKY
jgi:hypothetical protein